MPVIAHHPHDPIYESFVGPLGRMMLGYGRAMLAVREIALEVHRGNEQLADKFMQKKGENLFKELYELCRPHIQEELFDGYLRKPCERLLELNRRRNRIVHAEWYFPNLEESRLEIRDWDHKAGQADWDYTVTPESLEQMASDYSELSRDLDLVSWIVAKALGGDITDLPKG